MKEYIKSHPGINTTLIQQIMQSKKYELLFTPPYESWIQPIELIWARVKHQVATQSKVGRKWQETTDQMKVALSNVTGSLCNSIIGHTERLMDEWLESDAAGSLQQYGNIYTLGRLSVAQRRRLTDLNLDDTLIVGDAEN